MSFFSTLLTSYQISLLKEGFQIGLDWLGHFARIIIEGVGIIGAGIIVFTLVLKAITLPFDIYQRIKMRKQTLIMRQMQPELEKLQQTYANDKNMYNQKMMELYKKNGYSMLGACLPMIVSLLILIFAFQGFRAYSQYANLNMYVDMSAEYNAAVLLNAVDGKDFRLPAEGKEDDALTITWTEEPVTTVTEKNEEITENDQTVLVYTKITTHDVLHSEEGILYTYRTEITETKKGDADTVTETKKFLYVQSEDASKFMFYMYPLDETTVTRSYYADAERLKAVAGDKFQEFTVDGEGNAVSDELACKNYVKKIGASAAAEWYRANDAKFLWVKNVWYPDVSYSHPIQDYKGFSSNFKNVKVTYPGGEKKELINELDEPSYKSLVSELQAETKAPNGYFILIVLSIGLMVLSQLISMKSTKESNKYQTVDGSGARTQKMMLIMMPLIYAVFAFMYSAAFSIYMVISSAVSILVTLLSNLIIGAVFKKKEAELAKAQNVRKLPWMKDDKKDNSKKDKNNPKNGKRG